MLGVSPRYTFVPTARIVSGLKEMGWVPVAVEEQRIRTETRRACLLRYPSLKEAPVDLETLLKVRRPEDEGRGLWRTLNRVSENLIRGGVSDHHRDRRGKLRSVRGLRGIDSQVGMNKGIWDLAERALTSSLISEPEDSESN